MLHASTKKLIDRLAEMTDLAKLDWTDGDDGNITYSTEGYSVSLTETPNEVVITSKDGKELERAGAEALAATPAEDGGTYADIVAAMTKEAARVARGTETAISTLLAGMEDAPAETDTVDTIVPNDEGTEAELQEDPGDETAVLTDDSVEAVSSDSEPVIETEHESVADTDDEPEAAAFVETTETTEPEAEPEVEVSNAPSEEPEEADFGADNEVTAEETTELVEEIATESEDEVTEAVVRLADEVNQKEESGLDAAAASAVGAVALAAGLTSQTDESEPKAVEPAPAEEEPVATFAVAEETPAEVPTYVPFGLEEPAESHAAVETEVAETVEETASEPFIESATVFSLNGSTSAEAEAEPKEEPAVEEVSSEPTLAWSTPQTTSEEAVETTEDTAQEIASEAEPEVSPETTIDVPPLAATAAAIEETTDPVPADPAPVETAPEAVAEAPQPAEAQTYSLSGIGAGFGLGALSAKSEASGIPGPSSFGAAEEEKVLIDATEDVLPEIDGKPALPTGVAPLPQTTSADAGSASDAEAEDGDADILKPRTRFNPWD